MILAVSVFRRALCYKLEIIGFLVILLMNVDAMKKQCSPWLGGLPRWSHGCLRLFLFVSVSVFLTACASMRPYSLTADDLESFTKTAFRKLDNEQLQSGSPLSMSLHDLDIKIGPDGRDVVQLEVEFEAALNAFLIKVPATLHIKVEGQPIYDGKEKAIYIKRMALLDSRVESSFLNAEIDPLAKQAFGLLGKMLETVPVYRLDANNLTERILMTSPLNIKVVPGRIAFEMAK